MRIKLLVGISLIIFILATANIIIFGLLVDKKAGDASKKVVTLKDNVTPTKKNDTPASNYSNQTSIDTQSQSPPHSKGLLAPIQ